MVKVFDTRSSSAEASINLMSIRQGKRKNGLFQSLVDAYLHSLADYLKDELVSHTPPTSLDDAIALMARIDRRVQVCRRERGCLNCLSTSSSGRVSMTFPPPTPPGGRRDQPEPMVVSQASDSGRAPTRP